MKNASAALKAFIPSARSFFQADLFTITPGTFQNLLAWSEELEKSVWVGGGTVTNPTVTADATPNPFNTTTPADQLAFPSIGSGQESYLQQDTGFVPSVGFSYTFSVYLKAGTLSTAFIRMVQSTGENSTFSGPLSLTSNWQRFSITVTPASVGTGHLLVRINSGNLSATEPSGTYFAWGAQLEVRASVGPYISTSSIIIGDFHQQLAPPLFFTSADNDISWNNTTYSSKSPLVSRSEMKWSLGLTVDTMDVQIDARPFDLFSGVPLLQQLQLGVFDGARFQLDRLFGSSFGNWVDSITLFLGNIADIKNLGRTRCNLQVRSRLELLNNSLPRILFQPGCRWTLFDAGCALIKSSFASNGSLTSGSTSAILLSSSLAQATGYFDLGTLVFTSGPNAGQSITVRKFTSGSPASIASVVPLQNAPQSGDAFVIYPGCDKLQSTCLNKFNNLINFGGFPYIPTPETAV